jgi:hypothetical protein
MIILAKKLEIIPEDIKEAFTNNIDKREFN